MFDNNAPKYLPPPGAELPVLEPGGTGISVEVHLRISEYPRPANRANRERGQGLLGWGRR